MNERYWALRCATSGAIGCLRAIVGSQMMDDYPQTRELAEKALRDYDKVRDELDGTNTNPDIRDAA